MLESSVGSCLSHCVKNAGISILIPISSKTSKASLNSWYQKTYNILAASSGVLQQIMCFTIFALSRQDRVQEPIQYIVVKTIIGLCLCITVRLPHTCEIGAFLNVNVHSVQYQDCRVWGYIISQKNLLTVDGCGFQWLPHV